MLPLACVPSTGPALPDVPCWGWSRYWPGLEPDVPCRPPGRVPVLARPEPDVPCWPRVLHGVSHQLPMHCHRRWVMRTGLAEPGSLLTWAGSQYWPGFAGCSLLAPQLAWGASPAAHAQSPSVFRTLGAHLVKEVVASRGRQHSSLPHWSFRGFAN